MIPILAIFILRDGRQLADSLFRSVGRGDDDTRLKQIFAQVDSMLAKYVRAQLALAGLSFVFYSASMLFLRFPYAIALGLVGGALEFLPAVGWVDSAAAILAIGFLTHAHCIWMALLLVLWRLVQDYVNSPRIMGENLQLQPLTVLFALMAGGQVGGIAGLYLSVPCRGCPTNRVAGMLRESEFVDCDFQQTAGADSGMKIAHTPNVARRSDVIGRDVVSCFTRMTITFAELIVSVKSKFRNWESYMPRYLSVESEPVSVCCYACGAGFGFLDYEKLPDSRCAQCSTPLFLPHELEGIGHKTKRIS